MVLLYLLLSSNMIRLKVLTHKPKTSQNKTTPKQNIFS